MAMVSTYTRDQAVTYVREDLSAKGVKFYSDSELVRHLQAAYREMARDFRFYSTTAADTTVANQQEYAWPDQAVEIRSVLYNAATYLEPRSIDWLERKVGLGWRNTAAGTPTMFYSEPMAKIGLYPKPSAGSVALSISVIAIPTPPASGSVTYTLPFIYEDALLALACARVCLKDISGMGQEQYPVFMAEYNRIKANALESAFAGEDVVIGNNRPDGTQIRVPSARTQVP